MQEHDDPLKAAHRGLLSRQHLPFRELRSRSPIMGEVAQTVGEDLRVSFVALQVLSFRERFFQLSFSTHHEMIDQDAQAVKSSSQNWPCGLRHKQQLDFRCWVSLSTSLPAGWTQSRATTRANFLRILKFVLLLSQGAAAGVRPEWSNLDNFSSIFVGLCAWRGSALHLADDHRICDSHRSCETGPTRHELPVQSSSPPTEHL